MNDRKVIIMEFQEFKTGNETDTDLDKFINFCKKYSDYGLDENNVFFCKKIRIKNPDYSYWDSSEDEAPYLFEYNIGCFNDNSILHTNQNMTYFLMDFLKTFCDYEADEAEIYTYHHSNKWGIINDTQTIDSIATKELKDLNINYKSAYKELKNRIKELEKHIVKENNKDKSEYER